MMKLALAENKTLLIASRKEDKAKLSHAFGDNYGLLFFTDVDGYQHRGFPLSDLPMIVGEFGKVVIEE
jgi:hypothetical protein